MGVGDLGERQRPPERRLGFDVAALDHQLSADRDERRRLHPARWAVGEERRRLLASVSAARPVAGGPAVFSEPSEGCGATLGFRIGEERHRCLSELDGVFGRAMAVRRGGTTHEQRRLVETGERFRVGDVGPHFDGPLEVVGGFGQRSDVLRLQPRLDGCGERVRSLTGGVPVMGHECPRRVFRASRQLRVRGQRTSGASVQPLALAGQKVVVDGFPHASA